MPAMQIDRIDHVVLTVRDLSATCYFYESLLGMQVVHNGNRTSLKFGENKINLHEQGHEFEPKAMHPTPGSGDICLITSTPVEQLVTRLNILGVAIVEGPVERRGATGRIQSVYFRDPDQNLIEVSNYMPRPKPRAVDIAELK
jgi:catechol 2,3-dioxygenase-like lactoylglutathione lyase family enzyme